MKKALVWLVLLSVLTAAGYAAAEEARGKPYDRERLNVGNPTPMQGCFFTSLWGGTTSDRDVQELLHAYSPVIWDRKLVRYRYDKSVVQNAVAMDDEEGNRTYILIFYDDLQFSDGTPITTYDYAFSLLLQMDPAVTEIGGKTEDYSWLMGSDEYLSGEAKTLSGVQVITDRMMQIQVKAEALPYFYELSRLVMYPYPIAEIAPGIIVLDEGKGVYLSEPLTAEMLSQTILDPEEGYLSHPKTVSGAYILDSFDGTTAAFRANPKYKGNEEGWKPRIRELRYTAADNGEMIRQMEEGQFGLLNKVTMKKPIWQGLKLQETNDKYTMTRYDRTGLTLVRFMESSVKTQDEAVRKAVALCFDRDGFIREYIGPYGKRMDAFCGIGQWMYRLAGGMMEVPERLKDAKIPLSGVTKYEFDITAAKEQLEQGGWTLNEQGEAYEEGIRYKRINGELVGLKMTMGLLGYSQAKEALETYLVPNLAEAGIRLTLQPVSMEIAESGYEEKEKVPDMLYLGENFNIRFEPETLAPTEAKTPGGSLTEARKELLKIAQEMVRTEPTDVAGFMKNWIRLQERISETLPVLPVYSNAYYDFFTRELHNYMITEAVTWGEVIVKSYLSDIEVPEEAERESTQSELKALEQLYAEQRGPKDKEGNETTAE